MYSLLFRIFSLLWDDFLVCKNGQLLATHTHIVNLNFADDVRDPTLELVFAYPAVHTTTYKQRPFFSMCGLG